MVKKLPIIREIFKGDHNAAAAVVRKLKQKQICALSGTLNYCDFIQSYSQLYLRNCTVFHENEASTKYTQDQIYWKVIHDKLAIKRQHTSYNITPG